MVDQNHLVNIARAIEKGTRVATLDELKAKGQSSFKVIKSSHDLFTSWPQGKRIVNRVPHGELVVLDETGHFPWLESPAEFFAAVDSWLDRQL